jgi:hypothetical protein
MNRAKRYANVSSVAKELNAYYASIIFDEEQEQIKAQEEFYENEYYESLYGKSSRTGWLMENKGLSLIDAVKQVAEEERQWRKDTFEWLCDPKNFDSEIYSDIYKEYYGVRPHGIQFC